jgi:hypothetical protein
MTGVNVDVVVDDEETCAKTNNGALHTYSSLSNFERLKKVKNNRQSSKCLSSEKDNLLKQ